MSNVKRINLREVCGEVITIEKALTCGDANFTPIESPLASTIHNIISEDFKMIIRDDTKTCLGIVGASFHPNANNVALAFADDIVSTYHFRYEECITKDNGSVTIITARAKTPDVIADGVELYRQISFINAFNGKTPLSVSMGMYNANGAQMTVNDDDSVVKFKHTNSASTRMGEALKLFDSTVKFHEGMISNLKKMYSVSVTDDMINTFVNILYSSAPQNDKKKTKIIELFKSVGGANLYHLYSASVEFFNFYDSFDEKRLDSFFFGTSKKKNALAYDTAIELMGVKK